MSRLLLLLGLALLAVAAVGGWSRTATPTAQRATEGYAPAPVSQTSARANSGGPRWNDAARTGAAGSSPLVLAATSVPLTAPTALALGIAPPTPLPTARTDAELLQSVQAQLARLDPAAAPVFVHLRPATRGELGAMQIVGRDDGDQVLIVVQCPGCNVKALVPTVQAAVPADYLTFVCERHYAGCRVIAGQDNARLRQIRSRPNTAALPTAGPRLGTAALNGEPPFTH